MRFEALSWAVTDPFYGHIGEVTKGLDATWKDRYRATAPNGEDQGTHRTRADAGLALLEWQKRPENQR